MVTCRPSTAIAPAAISSCSMREKYSGVRLRREAMMLFLAGSGGGGGRGPPRVAGGAVEQRLARNQQQTALGKRLGSHGFRRAKYRCGKSDVPARADQLDHFARAARCADAEHDAPAYHEIEAGAAP